MTQSRVVNNNLLMSKGTHRILFTSRKLVMHSQ